MTYKLTATPSTHIGFNVTIIRKMSFSVSTMRLFNIIFIAILYKLEMNSLDHYRITVPVVLYSSSQFLLLSLIDSIISYEISPTMFIELFLNKVIWNFPISIKFLQQYVVTYIEYETPGLIIKSTYALSIDIVFIALSDKMEVLT